MQRQVDADSAQRREMREALNAAQERFTREIELQRATAALAEERHDGDMKRVLLAVDRERANAAKLQKELELTRRVLADQAELHRQQTAEKRSKAFQPTGSIWADRAGSVFLVFRQAASPTR